MKKIILRIVPVLLILLSLLVAAYPFISDYVNSLQTEEEVVKYLDYIAEPPANKYQSLIDEAREYNQTLLDKTQTIADPFTNEIDESDEYDNLLKIDDTDVMASVEIPKINVNLPVYHGTSTEVLMKGAGHLSFSSLPIGGKGTHAVISAHTGLSTLKLFSDLNRLEVGDVFFINCLGEKLAYQVDQITTVLPNDASQLQIDPDEDYVTLMTCTPFGVNTHRLLVRGTRIDYEEAEETAADTESAGSTWDDEYFKAVLLGVAVMLAILLVFVVVRFVIYLGKKHKNEKDKGKCVKNLL